MSFFKKAALFYTGCALVSTLTVNFGDSVSSDSVGDYARDHDIPTEFFNELPTDHIRVYKRNPLAYFHVAGKKTASSFRVRMADKDISAMGKVLFGLKTGLDYIFSLNSAILDGIYNPDLGAFALPPAFDGEDCFIRPSGDTSIKEMLNVFTDIPEKNLPDFKVDNSLVAAFILAHEGEHCLSNTIKETFRQAWLISKTIESESSADFYSLKKMRKLYPDSDFPDIVRHARAMSPFSREAVSDAGHATALIMDAYVNHTTVPTREEAYYANMFLGEMVKKHMLDYDEDKDSRKYYSAVHDAMHEIIENKTSFTPSLAIRAAELYIEAVEYFETYEPKVKPDIQKKLLHSQNKAIPSV